MTQTLGKAERLRKNTRVPSVRMLMQKGGLIRVETNRAEPKSSIYLHMYNPIRTINTLQSQR